MTENRPYDLAIAGGGLAGLSLSIQMARKGFRVVLFEKETYPFHKVCGEYISMESLDFLIDLGLPLREWRLPFIEKLYVTSPNGQSLRTRLPLGGFGISRYKLDAALASKAREAGVSLLEQTKVFDIVFDTEIHQIETSAGTFYARVVTACYGKKSNLDVKWQRPFVQKQQYANYVAVKYHVLANLPEGEIALHNFQGGYCGISAIEENKYCLCYLTDSVNLKKNGQSIPEMEANILKQNPVLCKLLEEVTVLFKEPITISQISFSKKKQIENHILCVGDAAGMIAPLCGNGMSMALHGSKIATATISDFLKGTLTRLEMETSYQKTWNRQFAGRLKTGRIVQQFFGKTFWSNTLIRFMKISPFLLRRLIRQTHGDKF